MDSSSSSSDQRNIKYGWTPATGNIIRLVRYQVPTEFKSSANRYRVRGVPRCGDGTSMELQRSFVPQFGITCSVVVRRPVPQRLVSGEIPGDVDDVTGLVGITWNGETSRVR